MFVHKVLSRVSKTIVGTSLLSASQRPQHLFTRSNHLHSLLPQSPNKLIPVQVNVLLPPINSLSTPRFGFCSSASTETNDKEKGNNVRNGDSTNDDPARANEEAKNIDQAKQTKPADKTEESGSIPDSQSQTGKRKRGFKRTAFSDSDSDSDSESECDLSRDDLIKLLAEKEELVKSKHKEIEKMQDKVLRTYAEMENVMERTRREADNSKKFAIQNFAKSLLDVADNLGRASSVVKESFSKIDTANDSAEAVKLLQTLLQGVEMTEKQLSEVLKKYGVEKFDPTNEPFDPHRHNAVFQIPDGSKPPGTIAAVLKAGYMLYDRVIRPAEVGVTQAVEDDENNGKDNIADKGSQD
ncbi:grpE protein homolog 2, mitochondrial [Cajanus cajan]|uniref:grpE protein homolog 2, mitochondrial n=1 Tax=Cajanus cajan TaxID=3821 RepID=UPI00098D926B|nr:grpE protein homolog 2, mitochondrial [Cajanus cajan]